MSKLDPKGLEAAFEEIFEPYNNTEAIGMMEAAILAYLSTTKSVIVPVKPTKAMLKAACAAMSPAKRPTMKYVGCKAKHGIRYRAMIQAAQEE